MGIALDGDADRAVLVDEEGRVVDGDELLALFARDLHESGRLRGGKVVGTLMSNLGLEKALANMGLGLERTAVGDRYVVEAMRRDGCNLGGEQSGHMIFLDHNTTGDGLVTALQTLAIMRRKQQSLSTLVAGFERFPQVLVNVQVAEKRPIEELPAFMQTVERAEKELDGGGRILVRYSGTEPKARVMVEGEDERRITELAERVGGRAAARPRRGLIHAEGYAGAPRPGGVARSHRVE